MTFHNQVQQNINQIAQMCQSLSQNEQLNVSKLEQMVQAERMAAQQLQQTVQLCNQAIQQLQQIAPQFTSSQYGSTMGMGMNMGAGQGAQGNWSNIPINTSSSLASGQRSQYSGTFQSSMDPRLAGQSSFTTNKDLNQ